MVDLNVVPDGPTSEIRDFLIDFVNKQPCADELALKTYDAGARKLLIDRMDGCLDRAEDGDALWGSFPNKVQVYVNDCYTALDGKKECPDFPDMKEIVKPTKSARKPRARAGSKKKEQVVPEEVIESGEETPVKKTRAKQSSQTKSKQPVPKTVIVGGFSTINDEDMLCLADTMLNTVFESASGQIITVDKKSFERVATSSRKTAGRKNVTYMVTNIICDNPDMDLAEIINEVRVARHLAIAAETIRIKFHTVKEVLAFLACTEPAEEAF